MKPVVQNIALTLDGGQTAVMRFIKHGNGVPYREPTPENVSALIAKGGLDVVEWRLIDDTEAEAICNSLDGQNLDVWSDEPLAQWEPPYVKTVSVESERNRRIERGFKFEGSLYPATPDDYSRIASWVSQATAALAMGVQAGNLRWHDGPDDFTWTDMHGIPTPLDAQQMIALGRAANAHRMRLDRKADALKADPPDDITDDEHWT